MGIMSYLSSPLWLAFLAVGLGVAVQDSMVEPVYFPSHEVLFPLWPSHDFGKAISLFGVAIGMLMAPKLLGLALLMVRSRMARGFGGRLRAVVSVILETVFSALTAPAMMLFHSSFVADILMGRDSGWTRQNRGDEGITFGEALRRHASHAVFGTVLGVVAWLVSPALFWWLSPMVAGLLLSAPLSWLSARQGLGMAARRLGLFTIPEEVDPPAVVRRAKELTEATVGTAEPENGLERVVRDPAANAMHMALLPANSDYDRVDLATLDSARAKLDAAGWDIAAARLTAPEKTAVLFDADVLSRLHHAALRDLTTARAA